MRNANMPPDDIFEEIAPLTRPNYVMCMQSNAHGSAFQSIVLFAVFRYLWQPSKTIPAKLMRNDDIGGDACCGNAL